jgi:hypothetical protein
MDDAHGWGPALKYTVWMLFKYPELAQLFRRGNDHLTGDEAVLLAAWRQEATRIGRFRSGEAPAKLAALLDRAAFYLKTKRAELAAVCACRVSCPEFGYRDAPQIDRDLYDALRALSRTAGPEVMLSDRVAVDLIESMTGRQYVFGGKSERVQPGITRAKKRLESRGYLTIKHLPGSRTTVYCLLLQGSTPATDNCLVAVAGEDLADTRPELSEQDKAVKEESESWQHAKKPWEPGRALLVVQARLGEFGEASVRHDAQVSAQWAHVRAMRGRVPLPAVRHLSSTDSAVAHDMGARRDRHTDFSEVTGGELPGIRIKEYYDAAAGGG